MGAIDLLLKTAVWIVIPMVLISVVLVRIVRRDPASGNTSLTPDAGSRKVILRKTLFLTPVFGSPLILFYIGSVVSLFDKFPHQKFTAFVISSLLLLPFSVALLAVFAFIMMLLSVRHKRRGGKMAPYDKKRAKIINPPSFDKQDR